MMRASGCLIVRGEGGMIIFWPRATAGERWHRGMRKAGWRTHYPRAQWRMCCSTCIGCPPPAGMDALGLGAVPACLDTQVSSHDDALFW